MSRITRLTSVGGAALMLVALSAAPAAAHISPDKSEVGAGEFTAVTLTVGHGCGESPTTKLEIQVPESVLDVTPGVVPGWNANVRVEELDEPITDAHGEEVTDRETLVTYTAADPAGLPNGFRQSFTLGFQAPEEVGEYLFFKTIQTCAVGETAWIEEYTGEGEEPEHPAPVVQVVEGSGGHGDEATDDHSADDEGAEDESATDDEAVEGEDDGATVDGEDVAATDEADDDDGNGLAVAALVVGAVGVLLGGAGLLRGRRAA